MTPFRVQILAADHPFYEGECCSLMLPTPNGMYGIQAHNSNMITAITAGTLRYRIREDEVLEAAVSGVTRFGLFLMLPNGVEGLLPVECLPPDEYHLREETMTLEGREAAHRYTLGTQLEVQVAAAVGAQGRVDFCLPGQRAEDLPYARPRPEAPSPLPRGRRKPKGRPAPRRRRGRR